MTRSPRALEPSVFGFAVRSAVALRFLRHGGGADPLEVAVDEEPSDVNAGELLGEWALQGTSYPAHARLFRIQHGYEYHTSDAGLFRIDLQRGRIEVPGGGDPLLREQRLHGMPMILSFLARGDISLHAAAVEVGSGAVILAAPSKYGKSTLAYGFQRLGHRVLSEDLVCCRPSTAEAIPGPALLRLRPDVFSQDLPPGLHVAESRPDRVFIGFDVERSGTSAPVPIQGVFFLRESTELGVQAVPKATALKDLWRLSFRTATDADRADSFQKLAQLAGSLDSWNLYRPMLLTALNRTVDLVLETVRG